MPSPAARLFMLTLRATAALVRAPLLADPTRRLLGVVGARLAEQRSIRPPADGDPRAMAESWQRAFPSPKHVPIVSADATTAHAEIRTPCPLAGTGDLHACHRMMAYDRAFAARAGARFVVLKSQATPGVRVCEVALRALDLPADDLVDAHLRA